MPAASPGSFLLLEAVFEQSRAAFGFLGERGVRAGGRWVTAPRARCCSSSTAKAPSIRTSPTSSRCRSPSAAAGGRVSTNVVTAHLETVAAVVSLFGIGARTWGRRGGPGGLEVDAC